MLRTLLISVSLMTFLGGCEGPAQPDGLLVDWCAQGRAKDDVDCICLARHIEDELGPAPLEVIHAFAREEAEHGKSPEAARATLESRFGRERARNAFAEFIIVRENARTLCSLQAE